MIYVLYRWQIVILCSSLLRYYFGGTMASTMLRRDIQSADELEDIVDEVLKKLPESEHANTIALTGELGAGKTTFTQLLAKKLGVKERVTSPTFLIMRRYATTNPRFKTFIHIDVYRIEESREMEVLKIPEVFKEKGTLICIEWPERIGDIVPKDAYRISIDLHNDGSRTVTYGD